MQKISITDIETIRIGQAEDAAAGTGLTVFISETGMAAGLDVRGGGPASRETELLNPLAAAARIHAVLLSGGSAFGLDAAGGVMRYLEERGIGLDVGVTKVPLVCQSCLFDLGFKKKEVRPDAAMAFQACEHAWEGNYRDGNFGAGCGATVGKLLGMDFCMKAGIGSFALQCGDLQVGAVAAVNALGDIYDWRTGVKVAGLLNADQTGFLSTEDLICESCENQGKEAVTNTILGVVITNGKFAKSALCKIAGMAQDGMARCVRPVHTSADGDSIYALSVGEVEADLDLVGTLAAQVMSEAILTAVRSAESAGDCLAYKDLPDTFRRVISRA